MIETTANDRPIRTSGYISADSTRRRTLLMMRV
jgi:hypothetical protein